MTASHLDVRLLDRARKEINELIETRSGFVESGAAVDYADYRFRCGEMTGLKTALDIMQEIVRSMGDQRS